MIYAIKHNKVNRAIFKANEDALTSSVFERLMYLPKELLHHVFTKALFDKSLGLELYQIERIEFWPNWSPENTTNKNHVQPDLFIRTAKQDIIIEAKRHDVNQQDKKQWVKEIQAYNNVFKDDNKSLVFIALGGLYNQATEKIIVGCGNHNVYMCSWKTLLNTIQDIIHDFELAPNYTNNNIAITKILKDIVLCFELFGFSTSLWLERFVRAPKIQQQSINIFSQLWIN